ncbi:hypothetical protein [Anaerosalibacter bizertensis]|uniref:hypothetical protein n=1 Tax=Anaerosalibacter bizertensis TaxID=932217 RepID=UPI0012B1E49F|nr:hypothetical protein [Anaerosalibacter bizertensis]
MDKYLEQININCTERIKEMEKMAKKMKEYKRKEETKQIIRDCQNRSMLLRQMRRG